jgi:undecaprenyl-diphosphatase
MIEILKSLSLGGIQGVSEFLPISSSAHLVIFPYIMKWDYQGLSFDVALHFGTAIAIIAYFWKDWKDIFQSSFFNYHLKSKMKNDQMNDKCEMENGKFPKSFLWQILAASIPAAIVGFLLNDYIEKYFHSPLLIALNLVFFGILLWLVDKISKSTYDIRHTIYRRSLAIGLAQCVALVPGVSRSGITMTAARSMGFNKKDGAKISFMLGTPAMLGAFALSAKDMTLRDINIPFVIATISAAFFGFLAIKYLLKYLERGSFIVFTWYRIAVGLIVMGLYLLK